MQPKDIDFGSADFLVDPYPTYRELLTCPEPFWLANEGPNGGIWLISRYQDATRFLKEAHTTKRVPRLMTSEHISPFDHSMLSKDPPEHTRLRALVNKEFTLRRIESQEQCIARVVDELIAQVKSRGRFEFISEFALPLAATVIAELLGVPRADQGAFCKWSSTMVMGFDDFRRETDPRQIKEATLALIHYLRELVERRRHEPRDDVITGLIRARDSQEKLSEAELLAMSMLLLVAGFETTANLLGNGLLTLLNHPEQLSLLKNHLDKMPLAIEEILRFESPVQRTTFRMLVESIEIGGVTLHKGQHVVVVIGAANRDPEQFNLPDAFDISRQHNRHIAFGQGIHFCLGAPLARAIANIALVKLLGQLPGACLAATPPVWRKNTALRGLESLSIVF
ncbi:MAG: cytochrome P450 [Lysobacteraceae bacterium]|nr:MAG: cytochrome P450 [Xanthomonadaceae bacterium]